MNIVTAREELEGSCYFVFKHSNRCPVSRSVHQVVERVAAGITVPVYKVIVHEDRELSRSLAAELKVEHASPQLILVRDGAAVWHASHFAITEKAVRDALALLT